MTKRLEELGNALIGMFVPRIKAGACGGSYCAWFASCWQCSYKSCAALCQGGCGCTNVRCGAVCG
ncbi:hypothetical protein [Micromonospora arborensis]|uniref:hypothetical protein n=1 Tax=Micromonospora arborensis TaxID=2116518 RepID=UPI00372409AA